MCASEVSPALQGAAWAQQESATAAATPRVPDARAVVISSRMYSLCYALSLYNEAQ